MQLSLLVFIDCWCCDCNVTKSCMSTTRWQSVAVVRRYEVSEIRDGNPSLINDAKLICPCTSIMFSQAN